MGGGEERRGARDGLTWRLVGVNVPVHVSVCDTHTHKHTQAHTSTHKHTQAHTHKYTRTQSAIGCLSALSLSSAESLVINIDV